MNETHILSSPPRASVFLPCQWHTYIQTSQIELVVDRLLDIIMDSSLANLAVVVCHGSYHTPAPYEAFLQAIRARGIEAYCPQRPSSDLSKLNVGDVNNPDFDRGPPEGGYPTEADDAEVIVELLKKLIDEEGKWVLLVGHSSGGWVATEAAKPELQATTRKAEGKQGGVVGIFYMGAFIIPVGESVHSFFQPKDRPVVAPPFMRFHVSLCSSVVPF